MRSEENVWKFKSAPTHSCCQGFCSLKTEPTDWFFSCVDAGRGGFRIFVKEEQKNIESDLNPLTN